MKIRDRWIGKIAGVLLGALLLVQCFAVTALAAGTGTVTASDVNIRSDATTSSQVVGIASYGETYQVGDSKEDESGNTWYAVTLSNGATGYIRSDFIDVQEESSGETQGSESQEQGVYQIIQERGEDGTSTYYFVDNSNGTRLSFDEIQSMTAQVEQLQSELGTAGRGQRIWVIVLIILLVIVVIADASLYMRLMDAVRTSRPGAAPAGRSAGRTAGRRERRDAALAAAEKNRTAGRSQEAEAASRSRDKQKEAPILDYRIGTHPAEKKTDEKKEPAKPAASNGPAITSFLNDPKKEAALEKEAAAARKRAVNWAADDEDADVKIAKPAKKEEAPKTAGAGTGAATTARPAAAQPARPAEAKKPAGETIRPAIKPAQPAAKPAVQPAKPAAQPARPAAAAKPAEPKTATTPAEKAAPKPAAKEGTEKT